MTVRIKELLIRYEDDGEVSPLSASEHKEKYRPLNLVVHHHCAPPPQNPSSESVETPSPDEPKEVVIDLNDMNK